MAFLLVTPIVFYFIFFPFRVTDTQTGGKADSSHRSNPGSSYLGEWRPDNGEWRKTMRCILA